MLARPATQPGAGTETANALPKGSLHAQWKRCGRPACRCARGALHGPYFYWFARVGGRLTKRYVRLADAPAARAAYEARRARERRERAAMRAAWQDYRALVARAREAERHG